MPTYKRVDGDYTITTLNSLDNVMVTTHTVKINGNLDVVGNLTYIETTELKVDDPFITVAGNNSGTMGTAIFQNQGLVAQTSSNTFAGLRFDNASNTWQVSDSVYGNGSPFNTPYSSLTTGNATAGGANTNVQFNDGGALGGTGNLTFDKSNNRLTLLGHEAFGNLGSSPASVANSVVVYHNTQGAGGTGLYARSTVSNDELINLTKAKLLAIIF